MVRLVPILVAAAVVQASSQLYSNDESPRRLQIATLNSDEHAESTLNYVPPRQTLATDTHAKLATALSTTTEMINTAKILLQNEQTVDEGRLMMNKANYMFREVMDHAMAEHEKNDNNEVGLDLEAKRDLLRKKYSDHDIQRVTEESDALEAETARMVYETMITFPECLGKLFKDCLDQVNDQIAAIGLSTIEVVVHEKRNANQEGYNKVVLITNELADRIKGRTGDGIVTYPFLWNDSVSGARMLGVDGKWNCHDVTPEKCCDDIKASVPNPDTQGNNIECHVFVPYGGIGNPRRSDRVFITLSPDGRVHEPPIIQ